VTTATIFETYIDRVNRGDRLSAGDLHQLASTPDILSLGMLADALRRRIHDRRVTFLRVAESACDKAFADGVPPAARELRLSGAPATLADARRAVEATRALAGERTVAAFSWPVIEQWAQGGSIPHVLRTLRSAGLDAIAELALDAMSDPAWAMRELMEAGFGRLRLAIHKADAADRLRLLVLAGELQDANGSIHTINPLPMSLAPFRPTTGYEDVKMVALARLAAPAVPSIQVDWMRYGPKLAQVALTFGADDVDSVSASEEAPEGRRRAPLAEIKRNIEAAGLLPTERDGRFAAIA
jgi:aminodeoxyfutalosine synthase